TYANYRDDKKIALKRYRKITVDDVQPNEQKPRVEQHMKTKNSNSGYLNTVQKGWSDSRGDGFFSYDLQVEAGKQMYLCVSYFGNDATLHTDGTSYERDFK